MRCQGDLATVHQLHHARIGGITVTGNRPQDLAALARTAAIGGLPPGAPGTGLLDEESLALRLLFPFAPLPLALRPLWRAVSAVPPGHHLTVDANGRPTVARWWQPPEPDVPLERAAETVRQALSDAVAARTDRARRQTDRTEQTAQGGQTDTVGAVGRTTNRATSRATVGDTVGDTGDASAGGSGRSSGGDAAENTGRPTLSADLSGGTDATGLCFLAAQEDVRLITTSWVGRDPGNDDTTWSARSAAYLSAAERHREQSADPGPGPGPGRRPRAERDTTRGHPKENGRGTSEGEGKNNGESSRAGERRTNAAGTGRSRIRGRGRARSAGSSPLPRSRSQPRAAGEHLSLPYADAPTWYTPPHDPLHPTATDPAAPLALFREAARIAHQAGLVAARGSRLHLVGIGGDELFAHRPAALNSLARSDPRSAAQRAWTAHHLCRWKTSETLRTLLGGRPYPRWLAGSGSRVTAGGDPRTCGADWEVLPSLPPWAHPDAVATVRRLLREAAAEGPEPFAPQRCQHDIVRAAVRCGEIVRGAVALTAPHGVGYEAPFLDNAVIDAALTLRLADRARPGVDKPLLSRALRGIVPDAVLGRGTQGEPGAEAYAGLRAHRGALSALCDDSLLAERGLIRPAVLRHHLTSLQPHTDALRALDPTLATEYWLRAHTPAVIPAPSRPAPPFPTPPLPLPARGTP